MDSMNNFCTLISVILAICVTTSSEPHLIRIKHVVTYLLKVGIAEPEKTPVSRQRVCKHVSMATSSLTTVTDMHATIEELLEAVSSVGSVQRLYKESQLGL
jgi:hypothetical protein